MITCVCPTTPERREWLPNLLECFSSQNYPNRELLIVIEGGSAVDVPSRDGIRVVECPPGLTLGAKRNFACNLAEDFIAHFDDDDWSAPGRLVQQIERLALTGLPLTGYSQMKFTDGKGWWKYVGIPDWPLGTSLLYRKSWWKANPFPPTQVASDTAFITRARTSAQIDAVECGDMMFARQHGRNTNQRHFEGRCFTRLPVEAAICPAP